MSNYANIELTINQARFIDENNLFKNGNLSRTREVTEYEIVLFMYDGGYSVVNNKKFPITKGAVRFLKPGDVLYSYRFKDVYVIHFSSNSNEIVNNLNTFDYSQDYFDMVNLFVKISEAFVVEDSLKMLYYLFKILYTLNKGQEQVNYVDSTALSIKRYIDDNFRSKLTLSDMSEMFFIHPVYLQKKFKKAFGITPSEYIKKLRIQEAKKLLLTSNVSVEIIAEQLGFCNTSYFIKTFYAECNETPAKFRTNSIDSFQYEWQKRTGNCALLLKY